MCRTEPMPCPSTRPYDPPHILPYEPGVPSMEARQDEMLRRMQEASLKSAEFNSRMSILQTQLEDHKAAARTK